MKNYENEVQERWGGTAAYCEHEQKTKNYTKEKWTEANDGLMAVFTEFAACKDSGVSADSDEVQALVSKLQVHITANYYHPNVIQTKIITHRPIRITVIGS